jgi:hypothetical protein
MAVVLGFLVGMPVLALPKLHDLIRSFAARETIVAPAVQRQLPDDEPAHGEIAGLKEHLVRLGATYMVLERIGVDDVRFRFTCNVPVRGGSPYMKQFQAIDANPVTAMRSLLSDVERWRVAGRQPELGRPQVKLR